MPKTHIGTPLVSIAQANSSKNVIPMSVCFKTHQEFSIVGLLFGVLRRTISYLPSCHILLVLSSAQWLTCPPAQ